MPANSPAILTHPSPETIKAAIVTDSSLCFAARKARR